MFFKINKASAELIKNRDQYIYDLSVLPDEIWIILAEDLQYAKNVEIDSMKVKFIAGESFDSNIALIKCSGRTANQFVTFESRFSAFGDIAHPDAKNYEFWSKLVLKSLKQLSTGKQNCDVCLNQ